MHLLQPRGGYHHTDSHEMLSIDVHHDDTRSIYSTYSAPSTKYHPIEKESGLESSNVYHTQTIDQDEFPLLQPSTSTKWFSGWRTGAYTAACIALASLLINVIAAIWLRSHRNAESNLVEVFNGKCDTVSTMDIWVHLLINLISTLLLGGSNYCMQCLCAPTRGEIDKAHANGRFLDVAVPSFQNLRHIAYSRRVLWWVLALSSIPLHLLYNSAFYSSLSANNYGIYLVTPDFLNGGNATLPGKESKGLSLKPLQQQIATNQPHRFEKLEPLGCIQAYAHALIADRKNLVMVLKNNTMVLNSTAIYYSRYDAGTSLGPFHSDTSFDWICTSDPQISKKITVPKLVYERRPPCETYVDRVEAVADQWEPWGRPIDYCLSEVVDQHCSFNGNLPIIYIVIVANAVKLVVMLVVAYHLVGSPLITVGDAIESFLNIPDETTKDVCYLSRRQAVEYVRIRKAGGFKSIAWKGIERTYDRASVKTLKVLRWSEAASTRRWTLTIGLTALAVVTVAGLLAMAVVRMNQRGTSLQTMGFGAVNVSAIIYGWSIDHITDPSTQILAAILIANLPQAILSFLYLYLNGLLTSMFTALEWSRFATERKPLRVSTPKGQQRSTHFLQLPYKVGLPLMAMCGILHWLVSQSIFLAVVASYSATDGKLVNPTQIASCGYSPIAMIIVIVFGALIIIGCFVIGRFKYDPSMPLAGNCSAAISAACHRPDWDVHAAVSSVQWGVIPGSDEATGVGHCSFTSGPVEAVQEGKEYAGVKHRGRIGRFK